MRPLKFDWLWSEGERASRDGSRDAARTLSFAANDDDAVHWQHCAARHSVCDDLLGSRGLERKKEEEEEEEEEEECLLAWARKTQGMCLDGMTSMTLT
jgi:hypothetical protein